jgi:hypothetical protein
LFLLTSGFCLTSPGFLVENEVFWGIAACMTCFLFHSSS